MCWRTVSYRVIAYLVVVIAWNGEAMIAPPAVYEMLAIVTACKLNNAYIIHFFYIDIQHFYIHCIYYSIFLTSPY